MKIKNILLIALVSSFALSSTAVMAAGQGMRGGMGGGMPSGMQKRMVSAAAAHPRMVQKIAGTIAANPAAQAKMDAMMVANPKANALMLKIQKAGGYTPKKTD